ncbi:MAG: UbiX family flavin prenyltransferase [Planctomycetes bacterium]|nr:UbiX family flavin prenyltransferase [Planctomycetota bacterium]
MKKPRSVGRRRSAPGTARSGGALGGRPRKRLTTAPADGAGPRRVVVAITGASGFTYGQRAVAALAAAGVEVHLLVSEGARQVALREAGLRVPRDAAGMARAFGSPPGLVAHDLLDLGASIASGGFRALGMAVVPCSGGTLGRLAAGSSEDLVGRAAEVTLKEKRPLVIVLRETPLSLIHLENMTRLARAGATILPAAPGFYHRPTRVEHLVDFIVARLLAALGLETSMLPEWTG